MSLLIIIGVIYGLCKLIHAANESAKQRQRERELARIRAEQARQREEQARLREEWKRQQAEAREAARRQAEVEREQARLAREQERQAREQARQAEQLARQAERLAKLEQQVTLADREIAHYAPIVDQLRAESERLSAIVAYYEGRGLLCGGYKDQLEKVNSKLFQAEGKLIKAQFAKANAIQRKEIAA